MMEKSRRSSGMYFLKVGNQVALEGEERSEATGGVGKKKVRPLGEWGRKKRSNRGEKAYRKYGVCHARFF